MLTFCHRHNTQRDVVRACVALYCVLVNISGCLLNDVVLKHNRLNHTLTQERYAKHQCCVALWSSLFHVFST